MAAGLLSYLEKNCRPRSGESSWFYQDIDRWVRHCDGPCDGIASCAEDGGYEEKNCCELVTLCLDWLQKDCVRSDTTAYNRPIEGLRCPSRRMS